MKRTVALLTTIIGVVLGGSFQAALADTDFCEVIPAFDAAAISVKVPVGLAGGACSLKSLIRAILAQGPSEKGEYETTAAFTARLEKARASVLVGGTELSKEFGLVLRISPGFLRYDADRQGFVPSIPDSFSGQLAELLYFDDDQIDTPSAAPFSYVEVTKDTSSTTYGAETALGIKFEIHHEAGDVWGVHLDPGPQPSVNRAPNIPPLHVSAAEAPAVKGQLAMLFLGNAIIPTVTNHRAETEATLTGPYERALDVHRLGFHPTVAEIVRLDTGEVLARAHFDTHGQGLFATPRVKSQSSRGINKPP